MAKLLIENNFVAAIRSNSTVHRKYSINDLYINQLANDQATYNVNRSKPTGPTRPIDISSDSGDKFKLYLTPEPKLNTHHGFPLLVTGIETVREFYFRPTADPGFNAMNSDLQYFYNKRTNLPQPLLKPNNACVFFNKDANSWERSRVEKLLDADHLLIKLVDRGDTKFVNKASLRVIHEKFLDTPCQAVRAALVDFYEANEFDEAVNIRFSELVLNKKLMGKVLKFVETNDSLVNEENSVPCLRRIVLINIFDECQESIYQKLVDDLDMTRTSRDAVFSQFKPVVKSSMNETKMVDSSMLASFSENDQSLNEASSYITPAQQIHNQQQLNNVIHQQPAPQPRQPIFPYNRLLFKLFRNKSNKKGI